MDHVLTPEIVEALLTNLAHDHGLRAELVPILVLSVTTGQQPVLEPSVEAEFEAFFARVAANSETSA